MAILGPTLRTQIVLEGESIEALVDTGSPATIVSLECIVSILAKRRPPTQSPEQWRKAVEKRLKKPSLNLNNYGGGELNLVRELEVEISRAGYSTKAVIQVHVGATVDLLLGTDLMSSLGFSLQAKGIDETTHDLLDSSPSHQPEDQESLSKDEEWNPTVRLIQAVKLPPRHKRLVRARVDNLTIPSSLLLFEPGDHLLERDGLQAAEAAVAMEDTGQVTLILENHRSEPAVLEEGHILGSVQALSQVVESKDDHAPRDDPGPSLKQTVNAFLPPSIADHQITDAERLQQITKALGLERTVLSEAEMEQLKAVVMEYADLFALNPFELD